jgi:hypothetical protein
MRKAITLFVIAFLALVAGFSTYMYFKQSAGTVTVHITQGMVDSALAGKFPKEKTYLEIIRVTYENPKVSFLPDTKRVRVALDARVELGLSGILAKTYKGTATVNTEVGYNPDSHEFFLWQPMVETLDISKLKDDYRDILRDGLNLATAEWAKEIPVYKLKDAETPQKLAKLVLRRVEVEGDHITVTLGL